MQHLGYNSIPGKEVLHKMKGYHHLTLEEREKLFGYKKQNLSLRTIADKLKRSVGTVSRELKRNAPYGQTYIPCIANRKALKRAVKQRHESSWKGPEVYLYVREHLGIGWSPETIAGRLKIDHPNLHICHETIYQSIYARENRKFKLWQYLTNRRKKRMRKEGRTVHRDGRIPEGVSIDLRPKAVGRRRELGHWESDNIIGKQTDKTALSVTVERVMKVTLLSKLQARTADEKTRKMFMKMAVLPDRIRKTMTVDNGKENANHKQITESLGMGVYFCHAYHSWEKGTVENTNGIIRRFIPKGISIDSISEKEIRGIEWKLNNTPRKCLGFLTPYERLQEYLTRRV